MSDKLSMPHIDVEEHRRNFDRLREQFTNNLKMINSEKKRLYRLVYKNSSFNKLKFHHKHRAHKLNKQMADLQSPISFEPNEDSAKFNSDQYASSEASDEEIHANEICMPPIKHHRCERCDRYDRQGDYVTNPPLYREKDILKCDNCEDVIRNLYHLQNFLNKNQMKHPNGGCQYCLTCSTFLKFLIERNFPNWKPSAKIPREYGDKTQAIYNYEIMNDDIDKRSRPHYEEFKKCRKVRSVAMMGTNRRGQSEQKECMRRGVRCLKQPVGSLSLSSETSCGEEKIESLTELLKTHQPEKKPKKVAAVIEPTHCCNYCYRNFANSDTLRAHIQNHHLISAYGSSAVLRQSPYSKNRRRSKRKTNSLKTILNNIHNTPIKNKRGKRPAFRP